MLSIMPFREATSQAVEPDENTLVRRAQLRDQQAFEALYRLRVGRIHALCLRMTGDARQAEELVQRAFIQAWEKLPRLREEEGFGAWLHRLAINTVLLEWRATRRRMARVFAADDLEALETPRPPPVAGQRLDLEQAIAQLPRQARAVFVLHEIEGYNHDEIAALVGIASGTSKAQLHRARTLLKEALQ
jgi:RNA polymerase sigma-70 factor (ECF subfamily)